MPCTLSILELSLSLSLSHTHTHTNTHTHTLSLSLSLSPLIQTSCLPLSFLALQQKVNYADVAYNAGAMGLLQRAG